MNESPVMVEKKSPGVSTPPLLSLTEPKLPPKLDLNKNVSSSRINNYIYYHPWIGKGGSGKVYKGVNTKTNTLVAIKKINSVNIQKLSMERIIQEVEFLKNLEHPNIIKCFDIIKDQHYVYIITEYCNGGNLQQFIDDYSGYGENFSEIEIKHFMIQIRDALQYLHSKNIYHRDIKPQNILVQNKNKTYTDITLKICDFGFAKEMNLETKFMETTLCGTPMYMAPEIVIQHKYHNKSDLWSLGVILHRLIYGTYPYGKVSNIFELIKCMESKKLSFPNKKNKKIPLSLEGCDLLGSLLEKDTGERIDWEEFFNHAWFAFRNDIDNTDDEISSDSDSEEDIKKIMEDLPEKVNEILEKQKEVKTKQKEDKINIIEDYCNKFVTSIPLSEITPKIIPPPPTAKNTIYNFLTKSIDNILHLTNLNLK